ITQSSDGNAPVLSSFPWSRRELEYVRQRSREVTLTGPRQGGDSGFGGVPAGCGGPQTAFARSRSTNFWIFPVEVFGISANTTWCGTLKPAKFARQWAIMSSTDGLGTPALSSMKAHGVSPHLASALPTTAQDATAGCL